MPNYTDKLGIPTPLGNETVSRQNHVDRYNTIDQNAALDDFNLRSVSYDSTNDEIDIEIGKGNARFPNGLVSKSSNTNYSISTPLANTSYYLYLKNDGTFYHDTSGAELENYVLLHKITTGSSVDTITTEDLRSGLSGVLVSNFNAHLADYVSFKNDIEGDFNLLQADYVSFKNDIEGDLNLLQGNFLDLLIARELESLSTEMDAGYWWDTLQDATKIQNTTGATVSGGKIITTAENSQIVWCEHEVGFLTDKITYYQKRTKTDDIAPVHANTAAGNNSLVIKSATITIT